MEAGTALRTPSDAGSKTTIICSNMPDGLFNTDAAKVHFGRFGRVKKILLRPKKQICIVEYDTRVAAGKALLNAGAYDGFMFDVTWYKKRKLSPKKEGVHMERRPEKEDDPDWLPDEGVEEELSAMSAVPVYRQPRQQPMQQDPQQIRTVVRKVNTARTVAAKLSKDRVSTQNTVWTPSITVDAPVLSTTSLTTSEAAAELQQLRGRVSRTPEEQRRTLDARDRILRAWGGTGPRVRAGGATIGSCPDMCPEKERLQRQVEHQVNILECSGDGSLAAWRAVKQYSRSSADQETPMCYELRPPETLARTVAYLLAEVVDCDENQVSLADWFQFMWDRLRSIRKDITQQALCCAESVRLVEQCARFHAHCAARLADLEHTQFDQRLNTDNLTKCLQTLKHMYADLPAESKPCEAEFRAYIALLNLGDANFCWEIKQLPQEIQKSDPITFAVQVFMALDNNNYVRFFRLVKNKATYLQACILLRYFNDVRARGLARIVKAYAPRGGSKYPIQELLDNLGFEDVNSLHLFVTHYGLKFSKHDEYDPSVILDRNQFIEDSDPYPISREIQLIESKRTCSVGEVIAGGSLSEEPDYKNHEVYTSFNDNGILKQSALLAEDLGYDTFNESNKDLRELKNELERVSQSEPSSVTSRSIEAKSSMFSKPDAKLLFPGKSSVFANPREIPASQKFSFKPAIPVVSIDEVKGSPEKLFNQDSKAVFAFSKPDDSKPVNLWGDNKTSNVFGASKSSETPFGKTAGDGNIFGAGQRSGLNSVFGGTNVKTSNPFSASSDKLFKTEVIKNNDRTDGKSNLFANTNLCKSSGSTFIKPSGSGSNLFSKPNNETDKENSLFANSNVVSPSDRTKNLFGQTTAVQSVFGPKYEMDTKSKPFLISNKSKPESQLWFASSTNVFKNEHIQAIPTVKQSLQPPPSPKTLFSTVINQNKDLKEPTFGSSIFGENKLINAPFGQITQNQDVLPVKEIDNAQEREKKMREEFLRQQRETEERQRIEESHRLRELRMQEQQRQEEIRKQLLQQEEIKKKEEEKRIKEELLRRLEEEKKQTEFIKIAEEKRKAEEQRRIERQRLLDLIDRESEELVQELLNETTHETLMDLTAQEKVEMYNLIEFSKSLMDHLMKEVTDEICTIETKAEKFLTDKLMLKFAKLWIRNVSRNKRRRQIVCETPVWLSGRSPQQAADMLRRNVLPAALSKMAEFYKGHIFTGNIKAEPEILPYNIIDLVRTSLLKGLKRVNLTYHECFFWKISISSPDRERWLNKQVHLHEWILKKFTDKEFNAKTTSIIYLKKKSWNNLMNFAVSVSMLGQDNNKDNLEGSNGLIIYTDANDEDLLARIRNQLKDKCNKQIIPVAILSASRDTSCLHELLKSMVNARIISGFNIIEINPKDTHNSIDKCTKTALKWLAKNVSDVPPLEIDSLRSVLHHCVGMEFWYRLRLERYSRMDSIYKDLNKLVDLYNSALENLTKILNDKTLKEYPSFPAEMKQFVYAGVTFPKTYHFFPDDWADSDKLEEITKLIQGLILRQPKSLLYPTNPMDLQTQVQNFCDEIEWFDNPSEVSCKIISHLPRELTDEEVGAKDFSQYFDHYDFLDMISVAVVEKINSTHELNDKYVVYDKKIMTDFRNSHWWYETDIVSGLKHKALDFIEDEIDDALNKSFANIKRMRLDETNEVLALDGKDESLVEESINRWNDEINQLNSCNTTVKELEKQLEEETVKASNLEELLRAALYD